ncbi:modifier of mdg4 isoform X1 [Calliphora vicina]|uniref:modifier of mdg4 isoform X1 n=1 Tax=Calliphora vicina TaxID=7373 RepID=UPI00325C18AF
MSAPQQYSLRWNNYFRHLTYALDNHRVNDDFVDVSLLCDGRKIKAHKVVLSACSSYFKEIFTENPHPHPVIIFKFIKYEDLNSIIEFMYQGEVNVQQEALQSFLQTAELLAVQGLTAEEKEKPKPPVPLIEEQKLMKSIPSTIRAVNDATTATQTIDIPLLHTTNTQQIQIPQLQTQTQTTSVPQQQQQHHHVQTQIQHIQVHQNTSPTTTHQVNTVQHHSQHQQQLQVQHQVQHQQQQSSQTQQVQVNTQPTQLSANIVTLPATTGNSMKKRKITFSDDDDNIYTTETVDEQTIVKTADMTLLRGTIKMDIPEYIVSEVDDRLSDAGEPPGNNQDSANSGQNVNQYPSEYEILTESEIEDKFHQGDNSEMTLEMGRLLNPTTTSTSTSQNALDDTTTSSSNVLTTIKTENKVSSTGKFLLCKICKRKLNSPNALRRHIASKHSKIMGKEFDCSVCHKGFKTKWSLSTHNSRFHRDMKPTKECIKMEFME